MKFLPFLSYTDRMRYILLSTIFAFFILSDGLSYSRDGIYLMIFFIVYNEIVRFIIPRFIPSNPAEPLGLNANFMFANFLALDSFFLILFSEYLVAPFFWIIPLLPVLYTYFIRLDRRYLLASTVFTIFLIYSVLAPNFLAGDYNLSVLALVILLISGAFLALLVGHRQDNRVITNNPVIIKYTEEKTAFRVGFVQFEPVLGDKGNIEKALKMLRDYGVQKHDIWVLPELSNSGYTFNSMDEVIQSADDPYNGYETALLREFAKANECCIIAGMNLRAGKKYYNGAVAVDESGLRMVYNKTHLFYREKLYFSPGETGFGVFNYHGANIGVMICFDWYFPEPARTLALMGADIIAHPSNLVLPHCPDSMPVRCRENRVFAITCNRVGVERDLGFIGQSQITAPNGDIVYRGDKNAPEIHTAEINVVKARDKALNEYNNLMDDRKPEYYRV